WGIVEGRVSDEIAIKNRDILNTVMAQLKKFGINTMEIGAMDAYFKVDVNSINRETNYNASIQVPSNFHLSMSDDTYLRVQPNSAATYTLMTVYLKDNTTISGGNLVGDRFEHDYTPIRDNHNVSRDEHGWGFLLWIIGSENVVVDNVNISKATGDGVVFHSEKLRNADGTLGPNNREVNNALIKNLNIDECRRNGISILDGRNITIDNCNVTNTGNGVQAYDNNGAKIYSSDGVAPRYGLDMEAIRTRDDNGILEETALIDNIIVKNSNFTGNKSGDIVLYTASQVIIENNYFDKWISNKASDTVEIINNTFESRDPSFFAISINSFMDPFGKELNHDYLIKDNKIKNYSVGIRVAGEKQEVSNNVITDCTTGIYFISNLIDGYFKNNTITSSLGVSYGYRNFRDCDNIHNVIVSNDVINVNHRPISFINILNLSNLNGSQITFKDCDFNTSNTNFKLYIKNGKNIAFEGNASNTDFQILDSENITL
ncbi:right-handed parallel beta-helix repeat-containing protein, partial [Thalassobellus citreus]|uniref:right-handed parallel beta-helix repeat-containing protein n=1 Tax=Thalassobellus citreus TaxID=3367752 RepID=UPI0037926CE6